MKYLKLISAVLFALAIFVSAAIAQTFDKDEPIKINTVLVNIPVIASDRQGRYVASLKKENFSITQDGERQEIEFFADEKAPMNVVILIDVSGSTAPFLGDIKSAARDFVKIFRPEDQGMIVTFDGAMKTLQEFTSDQKKLSKAIDKASLYGVPGSNMQDAMYDIVARGFAGVQGRKAIIVLTDGFVRGKIVSDKALLDTLSASDILVYPILFGKREIRIDVNRLPKMLRTRDGLEITREEAVKRIIDDANAQLRYMYALGIVTGGKLIESKSHDFKASFQNIADELKNQYLIGFYPHLTGSGKIPSIALKVDQTDVVLRSKRSIKLKSSSN